MWRQGTSETETVTKDWFWAGDHWVLDVRMIGELKDEGLYRLKMFLEGADYSDFEIGLTFKASASINTEKYGQQQTRGLSTIANFTCFG